MLYRFLLLGSVAGLASCAYAVDTHIQDVEIKTVGAQGSICYAYVNDLRYRVHPPQKISLSNTRKDMVIDCLAPGNRRKKITVEAEIADSTYLNIANAGAGVPWDALSGAAYKFPDVIEIDFSDMPIRAESLPAQNALDIKQPEAYMLEEFGANQPRLNSDLHESAPQIQRKTSRSAKANSTPNPEISTPKTPSANVVYKGQPIPLTKN